MAINCPTCGSRTTVTETRWSSDRARRRRICSDVTCGAKISTIETVIATKKGHPITGGIVMVRRVDLERVARALAIVMTALEKPDADDAEVPA